MNSVLRRRPSVPGKVVSLFESRTAGRAPRVCDTALQAFIDTQHQVVAKNVLSAYPPLQSVCGLVFGLLPFAVLSNPLRPHHGLDSTVGSTVT